MLRNIKFQISNYRFIIIQLSVLCLLFLSGTGYAQEDMAVTTIDTQTEVTTGLDAQPDTADTGLQGGTSSETQVSSDSATMSAASVGSSDSITDPDITTNFFLKPVQVFSEGNSGAAITNIPIIVPPGRKGIHPNIALTYNSNSGNGWLGVGWSIDMGAIQRNTKSLDYGANNYVTVFNGNVSELLQRDATNYDPKIEGEFSKYEKTVSGWIVTTKDGTKYYYGVDPIIIPNYEAKQENSKGIFKWCLVRVQDTNGNYMTLKYDKYNGEIYLSEINYTGNINTSLMPVNRVTFIRDDGSRPDAPPMYNTGTEVITAYRLKTIDVTSNSQLVRRYVLYYLNYTYSTNTSPSLLKSISQYDKDGINSLPDINFTYYQQPSEYIKELTYWATCEGDEIRVGDFDGDGCADTYLNETEIFDDDINNNFSHVDNYIYSLDYECTWSIFCQIREWSTNANLWRDDTHRSITGDFNGDGRTDFFLQAETTANKSAVFLADIDANFTSESQQWQDPYLGIYWNYNYFYEYNIPYKPNHQIIPGDFNGDGRTDLFVHDVSDINYNGVFLADSDGKFTSKNQAFWQTNYLGVDDWDRKNIITGDFNGDGRTDLLLQEASDISAGQNAVLLADRNGKFTSANQIWRNQDLGERWWAGGPDGHRIITGDFNGDGRTDILLQAVFTSSSARTAVFLADGDGKFTSANQSWQDYQDGINWTLEKHEIIPGDFNGDGRTDLLLKGNYDSVSPVKKSAVFLANGKGRFDSASQQWTSPYLGVNWYNYEIITGDFNGDGIADLNLRLQYRDQYDTTCKISFTSDNLNTFPDHLSSITNGLGGTTTIEYKPSSVYDNCLDINGKNTCLPFVVQTVSTITTDDGNGNTSVNHYTYSGGYFDYAEREFRGFQNVNSQDCLSYQDNLCTPDPNGKQTQSWYYQDNIFKGLPYEQVTKDQNNYIYTRTLNTYLSKQPPTNTNVNFPYLQQQDNYVFDGITQNKEALSSAWHTRISFEYNDDYGNITSKSYEDLTYTNREDKKTEYTAYFYDTANYIVSLPSTKYVKDKDNVTKAQDWFTYYPGTTNLYTKRSWLQYGTSDPITTYVYYTNGNLWKETDPKNNPPTITTYDAATSTFPVKITNPKGQWIEKTYDTVFVDKVRTETDVNRNPTTFDYDTFGRLQRITRPQPYGTTVYSYPDLNTPGNQFGTMTQHIRKEEKDLSGTLIQWKETYFDGLGRTVSQKRGGPNVTDVITDTKYNSQGLVWKKSNPYFSGATTIYYTENSYDPVGRLVYTLNPDSTETSIGYMQGTNTYIDANYHKKEEIKDMYGRTVEIKEYTGMGTAPSPYVPYATTTYWYSVLNNLETVVDAKGNQTDITYDTLTRKTYMHDPDMGDWTYQYDLNGNLTYQEDAKLQKIYFQYDELNRLRQKDYVTQKTLGSGDIVFTYDQGSSSINPVGRLTTLTDNNSVTIDTYAYDPQGKIKVTGKTINSQTYTTKTDYDLIGRVKTITYPDNVVVNYIYDALDNLIQIKDPSNSPVYAAYGNYNAKGQYRTVTNANGVSTTYQYRAENNRLTSILTYSPTGGNLMNLAYDQYDNAGNIKHITDSITYPGGISRTRSYVYDDLDRLIEADSPSYSGKLLYQYDKIGNMTYNCKYGYYYYDDPNHIHAVATIKKTDGTLVNSYSYDPKGNMYAGAGRALTYDYDNRPTRITANGVNVDSVYDANGQRVKKTASGSTTVYIGQTYECTGTQCTKYIISGTQIVAQISAAGTYYYHSDHLGSSSIITAGNGVAGKQAGDKIEDIFYYPYGETQTNAGSANVKYKYTGKELDSEDGLYYYGARYYDPKLARFISADTIVPELFDSQSLNRYSYVRNNPLSYTDPNGHYWQETDSGYQEYYGPSIEANIGRDQYLSNLYLITTNYSYVGLGVVNYSGVGVVPGYPQIGKNSWRANNDQVFFRATIEYNMKYGLFPGDSGYWTPERLKAQAMIESGGSESAFLADPLQVNNSGDWDLRKRDIAGISKDEVMTPYKSSAAAFEWLRYKGYMHDSQGNEIGYKGDYEALRGYNGNRKIYPYHLGIQHRDWYASEILNLEFLMRYGQ